jgi:hypothetical protein
LIAAQRAADVAAAAAAATTTNAVAGVLRRVAAAAPPGACGVHWHLFLAFCRMFLGFGASACVFHFLFLFRGLGFGLFQQR